MAKEPDEDCKKVAFWFERVAVILVAFCWIPSEPSYFLFPAVLLFICSNFVYFVTYIDPQEEVKATNEGNDEETIGQEKDLRPKESEEESEEEEEGNDKQDEGNTPQKSEVEEGLNLMELKVCLKELKISVEEMKEQVRRCNEREEERSQLIYELGSARASADIYREFLHDSPDWHLPQPQ